MKKRFAFFLIVPFLCSCSGRSISNEEAYRLINNFEIKLDQVTTFSFYERKAVATTESTRSTSLYQVFFESNYIHSYIVNEDSNNAANNSVSEQWTYIKDQKIYEVSTTATGEKTYYAYWYQKELWEAKTKEAFENVRNINYLYINRLKNEFQNQSSQTRITSHSRNESCLNQKIERMNKDGKVTRSKTYDFEDSLISQIDEVDDYSTTRITFQYKVTTQEPNIPDL